MDSKITIQWRDCAPNGTAWLQDSDTGVYYYNVTASDGTITRVEVGTEKPASELEVPITSSAVHSASLMEHDYVKLVWNDIRRYELPVGANILWEGTRWRLAAPYKPQQTDDMTWHYEPEFLHPVYLWSYVPFFFVTYTTTKQDDGTWLTEVSQKESDWTITDTAANILALIRKAVCFYCLQDDDTFDESIVTCTIDSDITEVKTFSFSDVDIISALSQIADEYETEWWVEYVNDQIGNPTAITIHLGRCETGGSAAFKVGDNVTYPTVNDKSENGAYTRFYVFGSTRNITQEYDTGLITSHIVNKRLTLSTDTYPNGYIDIRDNMGAGEVRTKVLYFDDIYPRSALRITSVSYTEKYYKDADDEKVQLTDSDGNAVFDDEGNPVYKTYPVFRVTFGTYYESTGTTTNFIFNNKTYRKKTTENAATYDSYKYSEDGMLISGKTLTMHFNSGSLNGFDFELGYIDDSGVVNDEAASVFEIIFSEETGRLLPDTVLCPYDGDGDYSKADEIVLYNIRMPEDYVLSAQAELAEEALKEIAEYQKDYANYTLRSNVAAFAAGEIRLHIGRPITLTNVHTVNGKVVELDPVSTRVLSFEEHIDYVHDVEFTLGYERVKGNIETLREEVADMSGSIATVRTSVSGNYLRRDVNDTAQGRIIFNAGIKSEGVKVGDYVTGVTGGNFTAEGDGELGSLSLREWLEVPELRFNRIDVVSGELWNSIAFGLIEEVDTDKQVVTLKLEEGEYSGLKVKDICRGIFHNLTGNETAYEGTDDCGFLKLAGFTTVYFTVEELLADTKPVANIEGVEVDLEVYNFAGTTTNSSNFSLYLASSSPTHTATILGQGTSGNYVWAANIGAKTEITGIAYQYNIVGKRDNATAKTLVSVDVFPPTVTKLGTTAFARCYSLTRCLIPASVTTIADRVFQGDSACTEWGDASSVTSIGAFAFEQTKLTDLSMFGAITSIGEAAFYYNSNVGNTMTSASMPSVKEIGAQAFKYNKGLTEVYIGGSCTKIYVNAFNGCTALESVTINRSTPPTLVNTNAFSGCSALTAIYVPSASVSKYQSASNWSTYADIIQAIDETATETTTETTTDSSDTTDTTASGAVYGKRFRYSLRSGSSHPCVAMKFAVYGNSVDTTRQASAYSNRYYKRYLSGVNTYEIDPDTNIVMQQGLLDGLSISGVEMTGYGSYLSNVYMAGSSIQFDKDTIEKMNIKPYVVQLTQYSGSVILANDGTLYSPTNKDVNVTSTDSETSGTENTTATDTTSATKEDATAISEDDATAISAGDATDSTSTTYNVITTDVSLTTSIIAYKGTDRLTASTDNAAGTFYVTIECVGCTAEVDGDTIKITSVDTSVINHYVDITILCEGEASYTLRYAIAVTYNGEDGAAGADGAQGEKGESGNNGADGADAVNIWLTAPVGTIHFDNAGSPSPSSFAITCKKRVGSGDVVTMNTHFRIYAYNGTDWGMMPVEGDFYFNAIARESITLTPSQKATYTQYLVRAYESATAASNAELTASDYLAELAIGVSNDGKNGGDGENGYFPRDRGFYQSGSEYWYRKEGNDVYRDKVVALVDGRYYNFLVRTRNDSTPVTTAPLSTSDDENWELISQYQTLIADTLFGNNANIGGFMASDSYLKSQVAAYRLKYMGVWGKNSVQAFGLQYHGEGDADTTYTQSTDNNGITIYPVVKDPDEKNVLKRLRAGSTTGKYSTGDSGKWQEIPSGTEAYSHIIGSGSNSVFYVDTEYNKVDATTLQNSTMYAAEDGDVTPIRPMYKYNDVFYVPRIMDITITANPSDSTYWRPILEHEYMGELDELEEGEENPTMDVPKFVINGKTGTLCMRQADDTVYTYDETGTQILGIENGQRVIISPVSKEIAIFNSANTQVVSFNGNNRTFDTLYGSESSTKVDITYPEETPSLVCSGTAEVSTATQLLTDYTTLKAGTYTAKVSLTILAKASITQSDFVNDADRTFAATYGSYVYEGGKYYWQNYARIELLIVKHENGTNVPVQVIGSATTSGTPSAVNNGFATAQTNIDTSVTFSASAETQYALAVRYTLAVCSARLYADEDGYTDNTAEVWWGSNVLTSAGAFSFNSSMYIGEVFANGLAFGAGTGEHFALTHENDSMHMRFIAGGSNGIEIDKSGVTLILNGTAYAVSKDDDGTLKLTANG